LIHTFSENRITI